MKDLIRRLRDGAAPLDDPNLNDEAADALEAQAADLARVSADARRYQWLRVNVRADMRIVGVGKRDGTLLDKAIDDELGATDAAIDAATKETP